MWFAWCHGCRPLWWTEGKCSTLALQLTSRISQGGSLNSPQPKPPLIHKLPTLPPHRCLTVELKLLSQLQKIHPAPSFLTHFPWASTMFWLLWILSEENMGAEIKRFNVVLSTMKNYFKSSGAENNSPEAVLGRWPRNILYPFYCCYKHFGSRSLRDDTYWYPFILCCFAGLQNISLFNRYFNFGFCSTDISKSLNMQMCLWTTR